MITPAALIGSAHLAINPTPSGEWAVGFWIDIAALVSVVESMLLISIAKIVSQHIRVVCTSNAQGEANSCLSQLIKIPTAG
jgi:hypothetical protein